MPRYSEEEINRMVRESLIANGIKVSDKPRKTLPGKIIINGNRIILREKTPRRRVFLISKRAGIPGEKLFGEAKRNSYKSYYRKYDMGIKKPE